MLEYLEANGLDYTLCEPLIVLYTALKDANEGIPNPILRAEKANSGGLMSTHEVLVWTRAAAIVDLYRDAGHPLEEALLKAAGAASLAMGKTITRVQVKNTRKSLRSGRISRDVFAEYERHLKAIRSRDDLSEQQRADRARRSLSNKRRGLKKVE